ncbi:MAG: right-handed parallel beta-helix repeat-containing protein [Dysgonamonadaceae bacterium]|nr:right-handed parallel beta-helix repeat-containing protein [Dysgonamonadaceae bacterium]
MIQKLTGIALLLSMAISSLATDVYLSAGGSDGNDGLTAETAVATLAKAYSLIPAANTGTPADNTIHVDGFIDISAEINPDANIINVALGGSRKFFTVAGVDSVSSGFDGNDVAGMISLQSNQGSNIAFKDLTFKKGKGQYAVANMINSGGTFSFERCHFAYNNGTNNAGVIHIHLIQSVLFDDCEFSDNTAGNRSVMAIVHDNTNVTITNSRIHHNASTSNAGGGFIFQEKGTLKMDNCEVYNNSVSQGSGGVLILNENAGATVRATATLKDCHFYNNSVTTNGYSGGAIYQSGKSILSIQSSIIENHDLSSINSNGGALYIANSTGTTIDNCIIRNNKAKSNGGAVYYAAGGNLAITNSVIQNSSATTGGAIYHNAGNWTIANTVFKDNSAQNSGAIYENNATETDLTVVNSTFTNNATSGNNTGAVLHIASEAIGSEFKLVNVTMKDNTGSGVGNAAIALWGNTTIPGEDGTSVGGIMADIKIYNSIFENNCQEEANHRGDIMIRQPTLYPLAPGSLDIKNSIIKQMVFANNSTGLGSFATIDAASAIVSVTNGNSGGIYAQNTGKVSGLDASYDNDVKGYRLTSATPDDTHYATNLGDASLLLAEKLQSDQTGVPRKNIARGVVDAGAVEYALSGYVIADKEGTSTEYKAGSYGDLVFGDGDEFTVADGDENIYYGVKFKKTVESGKWYAMGFPFDVVGFYCEDFEYGKPADDGEGPVLVIYNGDAGNPGTGDFFVKTFENAGDDYSFAFYNGTGLEAGKGYIIQFPSAFEGREITFVSDFNPTLTNDTGINAISGYTLLANPSVKSGSPTASEADFYYYTLNSSNQFARTTTAVAPFEAFIGITGIAEENVLRSIAVHPESNPPTGVQGVEKAGKLIATKYYNLQGIETRQPQRGKIYLVKSIDSAGISSITKQIY